MNRLLLLLLLAALGCAQPAKDKGSVGSSSAQSIGAEASRSVLTARADPPDASRPTSTPLLDAGGGASDDASLTSDAAVDWGKGTLVVHIGDSFTEASFEQNLRGKFGGTGARYWVKAKTPSYSPTWAFGDELDSMLWSKPQLVLITLGANEVEMPDPKLHAPAVRALAAKASKLGAACVWITPPLWKKDTGFMEVIRESCAPCLYFNSDEHVHDVERQRDNIHPNEVGGARWAAAFWEWLMAHRDPARGPWALRTDAAPAEPEAASP